MFKKEIIKVKDYNLKDVICRHLSIKYNELTKEVLN